MSLPAPNRLTNNPKKWGLTQNEMKVETAGYEGVCTTDCDNGEECNGWHYKCLDFGSSSVWFEKNDLKKQRKMKVEINNHALYDKCVHSIDYDLKWVNGIVEGRMTIIDTEGVDHHYEGIFTPTEFYKWGIKLTND